MVPGQHFDKPGKSPFMDMQLVPKYAGDAADDTGMRIDPGLAQSLGMRTASAHRGTLGGAISATAISRSFSRSPSAGCCCRKCWFTSSRTVARTRC